MRYLDWLKRFTYTPNEFYDHLKGFEDAASGNIDLQILPAMTGEAGNEPAVEPTVTEANDDLVQTVVIKVVNKAGDPLRFYNGEKEVKVVTSTSLGTVAINDDDAGDAGADVTKTLPFKNGVCEFTVKLGGTWAKNDTVKITVDDDDTGIMSYSVEKNNHYLLQVQADPGE